MMPSPIKAALLIALGAHPTPRQRRELASELRTLADEQERLATADERIGHVARSVAPREPGKKGGRPKGSGSSDLIWDASGGGGNVRHSGHLLIGRALDHQLGSPRRLDIQRIGGRLVLRPCSGDTGYAVTRSGNGMPRMSVGQESAAALGLINKRYPAEVRDGAIVTTNGK